MLTQKNIYLSLREISKFAVGWGWYVGKKWKLDRGIGKFECEKYYGVGIRKFEYEK